MEIKLLRGIIFMKKIVSVSGFMLTYALEVLDKTKILQPIYIGYSKEGKEFKIVPKGISLEQTIPKVIELFESNSENAASATIIYPAELENEDGTRESVIITMIKKYESNDYIMISQPYKFVDSKLEVSEFELLDYSPFLLERLPELETSFAEGALSYDDAEHIWSQRFKAS